MSEKRVTPIYWSTFTHENRKMFLAKTDRGLCYVGSPNKPFHELQNWVSKKVPGAELVEDNEKLVKEVNEIKQYLSGEITSFNIPVDVIGSPFQKSVWQAAENIDYGTTNTYQAIAKEIKNPKAVRAVGTAIGANPLLFVIPCHRVVAKDGGLSGFRGGLDMKEFLLTLETEISQELT